ncbi:hypothetical protein [Candidatus Paracaedibacter symbiosus]|uniref:hypothetical protein n=1 Tax=Candidatus Paracaedibacter symbiosus TaxID=244582 RepID=UPI000509F7D0|nr:hypothetical protein [Candidatus Paracaedibacter symbiosus]
MVLSINKDLLVYEFSTKTGITFVDVIKSHISPDRERMFELLSLLEKGEIGNCELSDIADELWDEVSDECQAIVGIVDKKNFEITNFQPKDLDLTKYRDALDWTVLSLLMSASMKPLLPEDIPFIREYLNCPMGQENEADEKWYEYWSKVDFPKRFDFAVM